MTGGARPRLSVCIIARDEEQSLPQTLASLAAPVDEVVVVDTGSRDATRDVARRAGARVHETPWSDDFAAARNTALEHARGDWCLMLDADEVVDGATWAGLADFIERGAHPFGRISVLSESREGRVREVITRLCRNDGSARYVGRIHEQLQGCGSVADTGLVCVHHGYTEAVMAARGKVARNLRLLRLARADAPDDAYLTYQLGRTLLQGPDTDRDEAIELLRSAIARAPEAAHYSSAAMRDLGYALHEAGRSEEALRDVRAFAERHPRFTDLHFLDGLLCLATGDARGLVRAFQHCLELGEPAGYTSVEGVGSYRAHHNLGLFQELSGDTRRARSHYRAALAARPDFEPSRIRLAGLAEEAAA